MPDFGSVKCREFPRMWERGPGEFRVFWYPTGTNEPDPDFNHFAPLANCRNGKIQSVQKKIKCLLLSIYNSDAGCKLVQFWSHTKSSSGRSILTVLEQPFGMGSMDKRFCRYRYCCMKQAIQVEDNIAGPLGRVFTRGSPEYSNQMEFYSKEEFPMRDCSKLSGKYLALPIFGDGREKECIGVLEFLSTGPCGTFLTSSVMTGLESIGLETLNSTHSHSKDCHKVHRNLLISTLYKDVLHFVRKEHKLPLIQLWIPCFCDKTSSITRLFCRWTDWGSLCSSDIFVKDESNLANGWHSVENGKGLVGRAYSQKKSCFLGDTSKLSISEYPLVHFTRSRGLTACLVIPVQSLDPRLHDLILEVFLPPQQNWDHGNVGVMLQSLLSALAQNHHKWCGPRYYNGCIPFELEPKKEFCVQYSHSDGDNFVYFDVSQKHQHVSTSKALGNGRERHVAPLNRVEGSSELFANSDAENIDGDQVQSREIIGCNRIQKDQLSSPDQPPATVSNYDSSTHEMTEALRKKADAAEKFDGRLPPHKRKELHDIRSATRLQETDLVEVGMGTCPNKRARENEAANANALPTVAIGKALATGNDKTGCCTSDSARENEAGASKSLPMGAKGESVAPGNDEIDEGNCKIDVMATYKDDTILFPLSCNSGIKELSVELDDAFQFGAEKFKIKYKHDDGIWITLLRDKDVRFHIETRKASGQSTMKLSVFPVTL